MKTLNLTIACLAILVFTSCKSLSKLTSRDDSGTKTATAKRRSAPQKMEFLENIEVTPGAIVTTRHKTSTTVSKVAPTIAKGALKTDGSQSSMDIENANMLQLKYSVMVDASVEKMTNLPLLESIDKWWGTKYCMGGVTENCLDCSAFTQILLRDVYRQPLPRTAQEQYDMAEKIELEDLQEGDLVFFHTSGRSISHVGVYLMNNKFVHAATSGGVMISDMNDKYWQPKYRGAGRVVHPASN